MRVIAVVSRKGGAGKTTLSAHLAVAAESCGHGPVALIDTDPQRGLAGWWNARQAVTPLWVDPVDGLPAAIQAGHERGLKLLVIDTPPSLADATTRVMAMADLVVVPVRPSPHDLRAVEGTLDLARAAGKPVVFTINQATEHARITTETAMALNQHGTVAPVTVMHRLDFVTSMTDGRTVVDLDPGSRSAGEITALWRYLLSHMELFDGS